MTKFIVQPDDPYSQSISDFLAKEFPGSQPCNIKSVLEALSTEIVGSKQQRYGPTPDIESLFAIREAISNAQSRNQPIPMVVPWGGYKMAGTGVDLADLMALKQLQAMSNRVNAHYKPGIRLRIRLEGYTEQTLYTYDPVEESTKYMMRLKRLSIILGTGFEFVQESDKVDRMTFREIASRHAANLYHAIGMNEDDRAGYMAQHLSTWTGKLSDEQIRYYYRVYNRFYPDATEPEKRDKLAKYLSRSMARYQFGVTGAFEQPFITVAFINTPFGRTGRRVYYRTMPERFTNQHFAPWIGQGYLRIRGRDAKPAIAGASGDGLHFTPHQINLESETDSITVNTPYVVEE